MNAWHGKGNALAKLKRYEEALKAFETAIALDNKDACPWYGKGNALGRLKRYEDALKAYEHAIALDKNFAHPWYGKARVYDIQEDLPLAKPCLLHAYYLSDTRVFLEHLKIFMRLCDKFSAPMFIYRVSTEHPMLMTSLSLLAFAEEIFEEYAKIIDHVEKLKAGKDLEAKKLAGMIAYQLGDPLESYKIFDEIDDIDDTDLMGQYYFIASLHDFMEDAEPELAFAVKQAEEVLKKGDALQLYYAGMIFRLNEDFPKAKKAFKKSLKKDAGFLPALYMNMLCAHYLEEFEERDDLIREKIWEKERSLYVTGEYSFLKPSANVPDKDIGSQKWTEHTLKLGIAVEISEALNILYGFLADHEYEDGSLAKKWDFVDRKSPDDDPEVIFHSWMKNTREELEKLIKKRTEEEAEKLKLKIKPLCIEYKLSEWTGGTEADIEARIAGEIEAEAEKIKNRSEVYHSLILYCFLEEHLSPETAIVLICFVRLRPEFYSGGLKKIFKNYDESVRQTGAAQLSDLITKLAVNSFISLPFLPIYKILAYFYDGLKAKVCEDFIEENLKDYDTFKAAFGEIVVLRKKKLDELTTQGNSLEG